MERQRQADERNERNEKLIKELRANRMNHEQKLGSRREEPIHSGYDQKCANQGNVNLVDEDVDMDDRG